MDGVLVLMLGVTSFNFDLAGTLRPASTGCRRRLPGVMDDRGGKPIRQRHKDPGQPTADRCVCLLMG